MFWMIKVPKKSVFPNMMTTFDGATMNLILKGRKTIETSYIMWVYFLNIVYFQFFYSKFWENRTLKQMAIACLVLTLDAGVSISFSRLDLSLAVVPLKIVIGLRKIDFMEFFQPRGTYTYSKKLNICLSMLFFPCYFWSVRLFCIWCM